MKVFACFTYLRACERRSLEQQGLLFSLLRPSPSSPVVADFIAKLRSGLTPDDLAPRSEVVERTESFL